MYLFWRSTFVEKVAILKKLELCWSTCFKKLTLCKKCPYLEFFWLIFLSIWAEYRDSTAHIQKKLQVRTFFTQCSSFVDVFILNKFRYQKRSCSIKVIALKNCLFSRSSCLVKVFLWKTSNSHKITVVKKWLLWKKGCSKKVPALKK